MPKDHRGKKVDGPSGNCVNCNSKGEHPVGNGKMLCTDCKNDYNSFLGYTHPDHHPFWEED